MSDLTFLGERGYTYQCRGVSKPGHLLPEHRCSRTQAHHPGPSTPPIFLDSAPTLAKCILATLLPPRHPHPAFPLLFPSPHPVYREKGRPQTAWVAHTPPDSQPHGQITLPLTQLPQNKVLWDSMSDLVCDDDAG